MAANVETMFYTRTKPWHGLGPMVEEAPTSGVALELAGLESGSEKSGDGGRDHRSWISGKSERDR